jgi:hypothetical protein
MEVAGGSGRATYQLVLQSSHGESEDIQFSPYNSRFLFT